MKKFQNNLRGLINIAKKNKLIKYDVEIARKMGLDAKKYSYPSRWADCEFQIQEEYIAPLCEILGCNIDDLKISKEEIQEDVKPIVAVDDFDKVWVGSKRLQRDTVAMPKILILEDVQAQLALWQQTIKSKIKLFKSNAVIQIADTVKTGGAIINAEGNNLKLILADLHLADTDDSLADLESILDKTDAKLMIMSATNDEDLIKTIESHPRVYGFIRKGTSSFSEWNDIIYKIEGALK